MRSGAKCTNWDSLGRLEVTQGHRQCHHSIERTDFLSLRVIFFRLLAVCWPSAQVHETITFLLVTFPNIRRFFNFFPRADSAMNLS